MYFTRKFTHDYLFFNKILIIHFFNKCNSCILLRKMQERFHKNLLIQENIIYIYILVRHLVQWKLYAGLPSNKQNTKQKK